MTERPRVSFYAPPAIERWLTAETERTGESVGEVVKRKLFELMAEEENRK